MLSAEPYPVFVERHAKPHAEDVFPGQMRHEYQCLAHKHALEVGQVYWSYNVPEHHLKNIRKDFLHQISDYLVIAIVQVSMLIITTFGTLAAENRS